MSTTYPHTLPLPAAGREQASRIPSRSYLDKALELARFVGAAYTEHQRRRADRIVLPYLALQPDKTLTDLGYSPELIKELRSAYQNRL